MEKAAAGILGAVLMMLLATPGTLAQCCGDCNGDGEVTVDEVLTAVNHALTSCSNDGTCRQERLSASGQTTAYGPGSDGDIRAGTALSYTDNGDGTITDHTTSLMWEKKDDSGGIHDKDNVYTWGMGFPPYTMNGTMVTEFLAALNTPPCFADHCDWRVPNVRELQSIEDYEIEHAGPMVQPPFHNAAGCEGCTDVRLASCSCTASSGTTFYWSSTTFRFTPGYAWGVYFDVGFVHTRAPKDFASFVRAVRGGW